MNYAHFVELCNAKGENPKSISRKIGLANGNTNSWKNGGNPSVDVILKLIGELNCTADELIVPDYQNRNYSKTEDIEDTTRPVLNEYRWNFMENTELDKFYNKVIYALNMLHGSMKANAMLSAVGLPADKSVNIDDTVLKWLADKSQTKTDFFTDEHFETGKLDVQSLKRLAEGYTYYGVQGSESLRADYPEMRTWDENYVYLFNVAVEESTNSEYIAEIFEAFKCYPNEHADLMAYIRQGIDNFEEARKKRLDRRNASMNAQKEETA